MSHEQQAKTASFYGEMQLYGVTAKDAQDC
jgi:hypothetical protein